MKSLLLAGLCALTVARADEAPVAPPTFRVLSFNIRYENMNDGVNVWANRREAAAKVIEEQADVAGLQEVKPGQRTWLAEKLPQFGVIGVGRKADDTDESVPVLYRKDRFEVIASGTFWLSETPEVPASISWESSLPRICTWVKLRDRKGEPGKDVLWFYNAHLDHKSKAAREKGLALVHQRMAAREGADPVILVGDFNCSDKDTPVKNLVALEKPVLVTTYETLGIPAEGTFHNFSGKSAGRAIDFILTQKDAWKIRSGSILKPTYTTNEGEIRQVSDHFLVQAVLDPRK
jgi:endonuclease/exonuclease/phosphatase family metal-dependent hydrolase